MTRVGGTACEADCARKGGAGGGGGHDVTFCGVEALPGVAQENARDASGRSLWVRVQRACRAEMVELNVACPLANQCNTRNARSHDKTRARRTCEAQLTRVNEFRAWMRGEVATEPPSARRERRRRRAGTASRQLALKARISPARQCRPPPTPPPRLPFKLAARLQARSLLRLHHWLEPCWAMPAAFAARGGRCLERLRGIIADARLNFEVAGLPLTDGVPPHR